MGDDMPELPELEVGKVENDVGGVTVSVKKDLLLTFRPVIKFGRLRN
jgi:hypothetical protein